MRSLKVYSTVLTAGVPIAFALYATTVALPALGRWLMASAPSYNALDRYLQLHGILSLLVLGLLLVTAPIVVGCFPVWLYRARRNLDASPHAQPAWGWGWSIVGWIVPVLLPFVVVDVVRESGARRLAGWLVWVWWASLVGGLLASQTLRAAYPAETRGLLFMTTNGSEPPDPQTRATFVGIFAGPSPLDELPSLVLLALSGALAVALVRRVSAAQANP